ncbi:hypothetical protein ACP6H1_27415 [Vibrio harveyi]|uniref:hypothetical protein n=1 Tax=Vibrio harveyi TaxID=669 RepID=UPI003CF04A53
MQINCTSTHHLNQYASNEDLHALIKLLASDLLQPTQRRELESYISRRSIENYLNSYS